MKHTTTKPNGIGVSRKTQAVPRTTWTRSINCKTAESKTLVIVKICQGLRNSEVRAESSCFFDTSGHPNHLKTVTKRSRHRSPGGQDRGPAQGNFFFSALSNLHNVCPHIRSFSGDRASSQEPPARPTLVPNMSIRCSSLRHNIDRLILDPRQVLSSPTRRHQVTLYTCATACRPERSVDCHSILENH